MFGWRYRTTFLATPFFLPRTEDSLSRKRAWLSLLFCGFLTFALAYAARLLELPFWQNPAYQLDGEYLLATHDAYHWIAGADGFEFGAGHPMAEMIRIMSAILGTTPAKLGFWLPPIFGALTAVAVYFWAAGLGFRHAGICAGVLTSLSPSFFARTLLGFCDTDVTNLFFVIFMGLIPTLWLLPWLTSVRDMVRGWFTSPQGSDTEPDNSPGLFKTLPPREYMQSAMLAWPWLLALIVSGLLGHWTTGWHSMFPYMVRFSAILWPVLIILFGPRGGRVFLLQGAACHALALIFGLPGMVVALIYSSFLHLKTKQEDQPPPAKQRGVFSALILLSLWCVIIYGLLDLAVLHNFLRSFFAYTKNAETAAGAASTFSEPPVFPSIAESIIEMQDLDIDNLLVYFYPNIYVTVAGLAAFLIFLLYSPALLWFVPLFCLSLLSIKLGGRMTMYGVPALMLSLAMAGSLLVKALPELLKKGLTLAAHASFPRKDEERQPSPTVKVLVSLVLTFVMGWPLVTPLPLYTQGPIISREHAEALKSLKDKSPLDSIIWNWWDWGYAAHHFAHRQTIADGARHGGPSLYLPAAVYATSNPRFARQLIKHTALKGNIPGDVFKDMSAAQAQTLVMELASNETPLIKAPGKQYLVVSFDLLRLGLWVNHYGSWNFLSRKGGSALMNTVTEGLEFNMETGVIVSANEADKDKEKVTANTIDYFSPAGLLRKKYNRPQDLHFIFNIQRPGDDIAGMSLTPAARFWKWHKGGFSYAHVVSDKLVVDDALYNSLMVQLLLCKPGDARFAPYFKLVFDNTYCRVFEVQ